MNSAANKLGILGGEEADYFEFQLMMSIKQLSTFLPKAVRKATKNIFVFIITHFNLSNLCKHVHTYAILP